MPSIKDITNYLEQLAPLAYQESYDNAGLIVGSPETTVTGILATLDCTEDIIHEAIKRDCNLIVAHHPIVFKGLKRFNGKNYVERAVMLAIKKDIAIYATHTNLDSVKGGVNYMIAEKLGLENVRILSPKKQILKKLVTFVPVENTKAVLEAIHTAGAGQIGEYKNCSFSTEGTGRFTPSGSADPFIGTLNEAEEVSENRIEVIFDAPQESQILRALKKAHPYEEVAYYLSILENENQEVGSGVIATLPESLSEIDFLTMLKTKMNLKVVRHTPLLGKAIKKIALCGGAGGFLLRDAIRQDADVFITADYKYHEFFDAENQIIICDIGHYESEVYTKELIVRYLSEKFSNFAVLKSQVNTNPVQYF
ncbi:MULTISPECIES: Nif3-like dinuclear metal center hexameric protein [unclassified Arcicella]|uniref:Nif3-like dinuclear metal center hexameric protein n=1 Tax=unclassified Arcicella TaxID=2644986 RepID=UPI00285A193A|nr:MULTISPECIES: Nif3-like dinuclear metal center hexameric protein [unclassified Arcicella]MDR6560394.1 dinuclear metal center YbgI/SA1388 family protein [Arcicella sp. BE51]MDR6810000.1 dinuclear metal center YbgI/SA1388 family protein [Arcicella sp. BE140]MDR6821349.1 dinuclear metal center YbgI/SA1388 family protein [Arcicella sp. BE139]